jgi:aminopeptidase
VADPRVERLAALLCDYSLGLREGEVVRLDGAACATPLLAALNRAALTRGAHPYADVALAGLAELMLAEGTEEQLTFIAEVEWAEIEALDALVTIWSDENTRALSGADPDRQSRHMAARRRLSNRRWERISAGEMRWCGTLFPTNAHAQDAEMTLSDYATFVYRACHVERADEDPGAWWRSTADALGAHAQRLSTVRAVRVVGEDTDLRLDVAGRTWIAADGRHNMPDGEVFTSPVETGTNGEIRFRFPAIFEGREVEDVRLRFEEGRVAKAEARTGSHYLHSLLDVDPGARILGELAFGLNYEIDSFTRNILFDEKIGGTMHFALGSSFAQAGGQNVSGLHWDMISDLRAGGEVYADGELVWKDGGFLDGGPA